MVTSRTEFQNKTLAEFIEQDMPDFAAIAQECGASSLLHNGVFKKDVVYGNERKQGSEFSHSDFFVFYIKNKSYILCEESYGTTKVWVAFTEKEERNKNYMTQLLTAIKYPAQHLWIETNNQNLVSICKRLKIEVTYKEFGKGASPCI
jgi:hypothetical protein